MKASELEQTFDENQKDVLEHFDLSTATRINHKQKRISVDFPEWIVNSLDKEASKIGVTRQSIIKMWLVERLESQEANRNVKTDRLQER